MEALQARWPCANSLETFHHHAQPKIDGPGWGSKGSVAPRARFRHERDGTVKRRRHYPPWGVTVHGIERRSKINEAHSSSLLEAPTLLQCAVQVVHLIRLRSVLKMGPSFDRTASLVAKTSWRPTEDVDREIQQTLGAPTRTVNLRLRMMVKCL